MAVAGFSVGEITALMFSGAISFSEVQQGGSKSLPDQMHIETTDELMEEDILNSL